MNPDILVFWGVVAARFLIPLSIPRFPLPGVIAALILDGVDQTIFQQFTSLNLDGYQGYDKALDIYYLVIAYISTLRNWDNIFAFKVSRFLLYYRLIGVFLFELTHLRPLLLIFPNTFEYFFIFYEAIRVRWNPARLSNKMVVGVTALIWIFIKLPQEYWLHIYQGDVTETLNVYLLGEPAEAPIVASFLAHPEVLIPLLLIVACILFGAWWLITHKLPSADWKASLDADAHVSEARPLLVVPTKRTRLLTWVLFEKVALVGLVCLIFAQILPGILVTGSQLLIGVLFVILLNTGISHWWNLQNKTQSIAKEFGLMFALNGALALLYLLLLPRFDGDIKPETTVFFVTLLTLLVVLFDAYHPRYEARLGKNA